MNIPQGYEGKEPTPESTRPPHISPIAGNDSQITYFCLPEGGTLPEENELLQEFAYKMVDSSHIREDLNNFAGHPAVALQVQTLMPEETIIYLYTQKGKRVWVMNFAAASQGQADDLIRQASESLTKQ
ncbi:hypothetical protein [Buchananella hordeovulneris]|uniref:hypothetical protein n=1 Tax=Buchananella hordeovulneris TaxID=52770 RepID=UPI0026DD46A8|nr:hypothetical protein [Buchananella hordeovulneris]MDO5081662.1 hypothetical protein [Buchananella hordeovulneris]